MYNLGTPYFSKGISSMKQCDTTRIFSSLLNANYSELQSKEVAFKISGSFSVENCTVYVSMCGICQIKLLLFIVQHAYICVVGKKDVLLECWFTLFLFLPFGTCVTLFSTRYTLFSLN